jgi:hypothetical protein
MPTPVAPSALLPQPYASPRRSTNSACSCFKETCVATRCGANARTHQRSLANLFFLFGTGCASETVSASFSETVSSSLSASDPESLSASPSNEPSLSFDPPSAHAPTLAALLKHRHVFPRSSNRNVVVLPAAAATTRAPARKRHSRRRGRGDDVAENGIEPLAEYTPHWPQSLAPHAQAPPAASTAAECSAPAATDTANAGGFFFLFLFVFVLTSKGLRVVGLIASHRRDAIRVDAEAGDASRRRARIRPNVEQKRVFCSTFAARRSQLAVGRVPPRPHRAGAVAREHVFVSDGDRRDLDAA